MRRFLVFVVLVLLLSSVKVNASGKNDRIEKPVLTKIHEVVVDGQIINLREFHENGHDIFVVSGKVKNKKRTTEVISQKINTLKLEKNNYMTSSSTSCDFIVSYGLDPFNNDAYSTVAGDSCAWKTNDEWWNPLPETHHHSFEGGQTGQWYGASNPDFMVFNQQTTVSGFAVTISWPPSFSGSGTTRNWSSSNLSGGNGWYMHVTRPIITASSHIVAIATKFSHVDRVDIYLPGTIYSPQVSFTTSWETS